MLVTDGVDDRDGHGLGDGATAVVSVPASMPAPKKQCLPRERWTQPRLGHSRIMLSSKIPGSYYVVNAEFTRRLINSVAIVVSCYAESRFCVVTADERSEV